MEAQGQVAQSLFDAMHATLMTNIFYNISYASLGILEKPKWIHTWAMDKKSHMNQTLIAEEWDNIHEPILKTNPKSLREETCKRMK